ncbi:MAG: 16S rRNA (cytidine(1402)-2'-O)-methyltransferase [Coriobacteriia bacterium]|nr:16S rRNA (cytidine(1402)-2'-O)-methyltransferase [Coriobacteriia bacterium]
MNVVSLEPSTLYIVATPIGNLGDISPRAIQTLAQADILLAEDTRVTRKLCSYFEISTGIERFDENTSVQKIPHVLSLLEGGSSVALVSDAGTPCVSDPGLNLVAAVKDAEFDVVSIPGASAVLVALSSSGIVASGFYFGGFVPRKIGDRRRAFADVASLDAALVFFESPHRVVATLNLLAELFPLRIGAVARELTKIHEEVIRLPLPELAREMASREKIKGEIVLVIGNPPPQERERGALADEAIAELLREKIARGQTRSSAIKQVVLETGLARNEVYKIALEL